MQRLCVIIYLSEVTTTIIYLLY